jgi:hypothetical protein
MSIGTCWPQSGRLPEALEAGEEVFSLADIVIVSSKTVFEIKSSFHLRTYLGLNAADYESYSKVLLDQRFPDDLDAFSTPRLGCSGLIGDKVDFELLLRLDQASPQWSLVFSGEARFAQPSELWPLLLSLPNVRYLGQVNISRVPHYVKGFQAGLMPYRQNLQSESISPLKLHDYLATGIPVASVDIPAAQEFRRRVPAQNTWEARAEDMSSILLETLNS